MPLTEVKTACLFADMYRLSTVERWRQSSASEPITSLLDNSGGSDSCG
jgi:hypothetical protein